MDFIVNNIAWIALAAISGGMLFIPMLRGANSSALSPAQTVMLVNRQNALMLDVRDTSEFKTAYVANSRNIPVSELEKRLDELAKFRGKPIVAICASGNRSMRAVSILRKAGFEQAYNLAGGMAAWREAGQPISTQKAE
ncbi:MAG: rhodanese-like domain-containing protein [Uliginosibacterium sp.]|jgi:rhodanese-related sulfurtransferase|nr:rhodanese-like domain-containing protein [Uliginosibacterium sp.]MBK9614639.1 rhodanese-like domain-containing protein [Uliginosibacterium sp.]